MWRVIAKSFAAVSAIAGVVGWITIPDDAALWPERVGPLLASMSKDDLIIILFVITVSVLSLTFLGQHAQRVGQGAARYIARRASAPLPDRIRPDTSIWKAVIYIAEDSQWRDRYDEYILGAARELRQEALAGNLIIWGKRSIEMTSSFQLYKFSDVHTAIDKEYWMKNRYLYVPSSQKGTAEEVPDTIPESGPDSDSICYIDLMVL